MHKKNKYLREKYIQTAKENGLMYKWISQKLSISNSTMSNWRLGNFDMAEEKLNTIESFLKKYE